MLTVSNTLCVILRYHLGCFLGWTVFMIHDFIVTLLLNSDVAAYFVLF